MSEIKRASDRYTPQEHLLAKDVDAELNQIRPRRPRTTPEEALAALEKRPRKNPETFGISLERYRKEIPASIRALADALHVFAGEGQNREAITEAFDGTYPSEKIDADYSEMLRIERAIERDSSEHDHVNALYALALEFLMKELSNAWFDDCEIWKATKYDDYKRGTDLFMSVPSLDGGTTPLAIDVTYSREKAEQKIEACIEELSRAHLHDVEYFNPSELIDHPRGRTNMPRVIVGAPFKVIEKMASAYLRFRKHGSKKSGPSKQEELEKLQWHELGGQVYVSILRQLRYALIQMRGHSVATPAEFTTRKSAIEARIQQLKTAIDGLEERYEAWKRGREEYIKKDGSVEPMLAAPENVVLSALDATL